jgi:predicted transcriptional regulator
VEVLLKTINQLMHARDGEVWSVSPDDSVYNAVKLLVDKNIGALLVVQQGKPVGVVSERDCARKVLLSDKSAQETQVSEIMSSRVIYAKPSHTIDECMALMTEKRVRHLPILEDDKVLCMISLGDLVKSVISEQQHIIDQLEHYISG